MAEAWQGLSPECYSLYESIYWCLSGLTCEEYEQWDDAGPGDYPCSEEEFAFLDACN